ncbi:hypothetical protein RSOL_413050 [Rhizoctonia solani AG-3 Rhs1AP]|uniref:YEATS domain-containing protein n=1 Tax=Rhizoctonia solani AG-3 Rhs1AP TaxID=1086054 RepID=X8JEJ0_9AGAM|nr:hypothetical protein RSOL_413050 [Rhizoctonia solani AG-3 Rhs1AP]
MEVELDGESVRNHEAGGPTQVQSSDTVIAVRAGREDELRAILTHQIELDIALRKRVAGVIEARIAWAEQVKNALVKGQGKQATPDPVQAKRQALESFRALHTPLDLDPHTSHPRGSLLLASEPSVSYPPSSTFKYLYLIPESSNHTLLLISCPHPSCPTPHPSATLQGLLNHARIVHGQSYAYASHDEFLRSPGTSTLIDAVQDPERYARILNEGVQVKLGGVRGLRELFEGAVESAGLGLSTDTGELARLLGRKARKGEIRAFGQDEVVDIESVDESIGAEKWKKYGVWAPRRGRRKVQIENDGEELAQESIATPVPETAHAEVLAIQHAPGASRFHIKKRVVISDSSRSLRRGSVQADGPTHQWMIRLTAPSYSDHITTFLSAVRVQCASVPPVFEDTITCSSPPFAISRLSKQPFLARVTLVFADENTKDVVITHWVDLDPARSGSTTLGAEQIFDVELNKNAQLLPADTSTDNVPNSVLWSHDRGESDGTSNAQEPTSDVIVKSEPPAEISLDTGDLIGEKVPGEYPEPIHDKLIPILSKLRARLPLTMEDAARVGYAPQVPYMLFDSRRELLDAVHGRRKAIEMRYTRAMIDMLKTEYTTYDADLEPDLVETLTTTRLYAHLLAEQTFPRPKIPVASVKVEDTTPVPDEQVQFTSEGAQYCAVCGLDISRHPPTSRTLGPSKFACIASRSYQRPTCDVGLWTTLRPSREHVQRVNLTPGAITTLGTRAPLRGASQLVDCASPRMTLAFYAFTHFWKLKTFEYAARRHNTNSQIEVKLPLESLGIDASHVDRTLAPHALLALIAEIFIKRLTKEASRARSEMLGELARVPGKSILTSTHVSRALMDGRNSEGWLPLIAIARIGALHSDNMNAIGI